MAKLTSLQKGRVIPNSSAILTLECDCGRSHIVEIIISGYKIDTGLLDTRSRAPMETKGIDVPRFQGRTIA